MYILYMSYLPGRYVYDVHFIYAIPTWSFRAAAKSKYMYIFYSTFYFNRKLLIILKAFDYINI